MSSLGLALVKDRAKSPDTAGSSKAFGEIGQHLQRADQGDRSRLLTATRGARMGDKRQIKSTERQIDLRAEIFGSKAQLGSGTMASSQFLEVLKTQQGKALSKLIL